MVEGRIEDILMIVEQELILKCLKLIVFIGFILGG